MRARDAFAPLLPGDPREVDHWEKTKADPLEGSQVFPPDAVPLPDVPTPPPAENARRAPDPYAETAIYKEHSFRWRARDLNALGPNFSIVELARWHAPSGHVGIISSIATHIGINIPIEDGEPTPMPQVLEIGLNLPWQPWLYQVFGIPLRWWLRLESQRERVELAPVALRVVGEPPGQPFPELPTWNDCRFAWHWHGREPLRLIVPEGHTARLFVGIDPTMFDRPPSSAAAKLAEIPQPSPFHVDPNSPAAQQAIAVGSQGAIVPEQLGQVDAASSSASEPDAAIIVRPDDSGLAFAGRLIGTIQTYRKSRNATEAARRGL